MIFFAGALFTAVAVVSHVLWIGSAVRRGCPRGRAARPARLFADAAGVADLAGRVAHRDLDVEERRRELNRALAEEFERAGAEEGARSADGPGAERTAPHGRVEHPGTGSDGGVRGLDEDLESVRALLSRMEGRASAHG